MMVLVTYNVETQTESGKRRLRQIAKMCQDRGQRIRVPSLNVYWIPPSGRSSAPDY